MLSGNNSSWEKQQISKGNPLPLAKAQMLLGVNVLCLENLPSHHSKPGAPTPRLLRHGPVSTPTEGRAGSQLQTGPEQSSEGQKIGRGVEVSTSGVFRAFWKLELTAQLLQAGTTNTLLVLLPGDLCTCVLRRRKQSQGLGLYLLFCPRPGAGRHSDILECGSFGRKP